MEQVTSSERIQVWINGEEHAVPPDLNLLQLIGHLELKGDRIAIEWNREIVKKDRWAECRVTPGDRIEIVHFVGGGSC
ncbi:MAG: sulfur carrier protein ThiS [Acidobacteriota bacterium]